ncbi:unnamed protein product [Scytosiphon promiscuus]
MSGDGEGKKQRLEEAGGEGDATPVLKGGGAADPDKLPCPFVKEGPRWSAPIAHRQERSPSCDSTQDSSSSSGSGSGSGSGSTSSKEWTPFFSCDGKENDPDRVVAHAPAPATASTGSTHESPGRASRAASALISRLLSREGLSRVATVALSRKPKAAKSNHERFRGESESESDGDDSVEISFFVPPSVKAVLRRCASQGEDRAESGGGGGGGGGGVAEEGGSGNHGDPPSSAR